MKNKNSKRKYKVLVTNAELNNALSIIRSLGKKEYIIGTAGDSKISRCFFSKYCKKRFVYQSPTKNTDSFIEDLLHIVKNYKYDILLPVGTNTTIPISLYKEKLSPHIKIPIADHKTIMKAHDKENTLSIAKKIGIPIPKTYYPQNMKELKNIASKLDYPVVVKPKKSAASIGLKHVFSPDDLIRNYSLNSNSNIIFDNRTPLIQEYIPGEIHDICVLFNQGEPRAALTQKRLWTYPVSGGWGVINETTEEPELMELAFKLIKKIRWHGVAQVEFKIDPRDNKPKLMEINPKFWGTLELSIIAGIDFPHLLCKMIFEEDIEQNYKYKKGLKIIRMGSGIFGNILQSDNFLKTIKELNKFYKNHSHTDVYLNDILPHLITIPLSFIKASKETIQLKR